MKIFSFLILIASFINATHIHLADIDHKESWLEGILKYATSKNETMAVHFQSRSLSRPLTFRAVHYQGCPLSEPLTFRAVHFDCFFRLLVGKVRSYQ